MSVKKGLTIFLLLSVLMSGTILFFSLDASSWDVFKQADGRKMCVAMLLVVAVWLFDAMKLATLTKAAGERLGFTLALELTWINYFGAAITPMQSGGGPFQMYIMYKNGISVGKTVAITLIRTILTMLILGLSIPLSLLLKHELPKMGWGMRGVIAYIIFFSMAAWIGVVLSVVRPKLIKRFFGKIIMLLKKLGFLKPNRVIAILRRVSQEIDAYNQNVWAFITTGRNYFLMGVACAGLQMLAQLSVMPCMIWAMGMEVAYFQCVLMQALFLFVLYFIPTPGGSGVAELGAAGIFSLFVPENIAGLLGVGWRFFTEYTGIFLGAIVALKLIGWSLANQIITKDEAEVENAVNEERCDEGESGGKDI